MRDGARWTGTSLLLEQAEALSATARTATVVIGRRSIGFPVQGKNLKSVIGTRPRPASALSCLSQASFRARHCSAVGQDCALIATGLRGILMAPWNLRG